MRRLFPILPSSYPCVPVDKSKAYLSPSGSSPPCGLGEQLDMSTPLARGLSWDWCTSSKFIRSQMPYYTDSKETVWLAAGICSWFCSSYWVDNNKAVCFERIIRFLFYEEPSHTSPLCGGLKSHIVNRAFLDLATRLVWYRREHVPTQLWQDREKSWNFGFEASRNCVVVSIVS